MKPASSLGRRIACGGVLLVGMSTATAQSTLDAHALQTRSLAASCAACHGTDGRAVAGGAMVALAGYPRDALIAQMHAFRDGTRGATVMHQIAKGYSDAQIDALASYFAAQTARQP